MTSTSASVTVIFSRHLQSLSLSVATTGAEVVGAGSGGVGAGVEGRVEVGVEVGVEVRSPGKLSNCAEISRRASVGPPTRSEVGLAVAERASLMPATRTEVGLAVAEKISLQVIHRPCVLSQ